MTSSPGGDGHHKRGRPHRQLARGLPWRNRWSRGWLFGQRFLDLEPRIGNVSKTLAWVLLQAAPEKRTDDGRRRCGERGPVGFGFHHAAQDLHDCLARERRPARQHLVQDDAKGPDIGSRVRCLALRLFRRHVGRGAEDQASSCRAALIVGDVLTVSAASSGSRLGEAEVQDLHSRPPRTLMLAGFRSR